MILHDDMRNLQPAPYQNIILPCKRVYDAQKVYHFRCTILGANLNTKGEREQCDLRFHFPFVVGDVEMDVAGGGIGVGEHCFF